MFSDAFLWLTDTIASNVPSHVSPAQTSPAKQNTKVSLDCNSKIAAEVNGTIAYKHSSPRQENMFESLCVWKQLFGESGKTATAAGAFVVVKEDKKAK